LKRPRVHPCECGGIHETFPIPPGGFNLTADGTLVDAWPYFPGLKVGKLFLYSSFFENYLVALITNRKQGRRMAGVPSHYIKNKNLREN
jgi:hypothetical protein